MSVDDPAASRARFETSPVADCSPYQNVDFRQHPSCVRLFSELAACCAHLSAVKTYLFHITLHACGDWRVWREIAPSDGTPRPAEDAHEQTCRELLSASELKRQCDYLRGQPMCTPGELFACGSTESSGCYRTYFCSVRRLLECKKADASGKHACVCTTDKGSTTFESSTICDYGELPALAFLANDACGWRLSMRYRAPREGER
ncbi:MAG: hypothetical protein KC503_25455 [Myxococcales bacterium]|nr:hypothetical protein [Myxococcales bacterium]